MSKAKRFVGYRRVEPYVEQRFAPLNLVQKRVTAKLTDYASQHSVRLSRRTLQYLLGEIEGNKVSDLAPDEVLKTLERVLEQVERRKRNAREISFAVLVRTFREWDCPRPWC